MKDIVIFLGSGIQTRHGWQGLCVVKIGADGSLWRDLKTVHKEALPS